MDRFYVEADEEGARIVGVLESKDKAIIPLTLLTSALCFVKTAQFIHCRKRPHLRLNLKLMS